MCQTAPFENDPSLCIAALGRPERVWTISSIHGQTASLTALHDAVYDAIGPGDRLVYLGNYTGYGPDSLGAVDEILAFRRMILSKPGMVPGDIVYLRGGQEEMWQKLLQIQFAPSPGAVLDWILSNGISSTLHSYALSAQEGVESCRGGVMGLTKWTAKIRAAIKANPGHEVFYNQFKRAAATERNHSYPMLFVNTGLDTRKSLCQQGDSFWWSSDMFERMVDSYAPFAKVVRGYDPAHRGIHLNCVQATIDGGAGFGGKVVCAGFDRDGNIFDILEA